ncbi:MAG TPA: DNA ligase D [Candidatus Binataceae bacterium]|nr:DNA ligase D [Candidatus Binataceae bacterium]
MPLEKYRQKRDPDRTPEPFGGQSPLPGAVDRGMFVVQKHAARRLHYDFRLGMEGVLRSWAIPKGPSLSPRERRLAVMVEDHPVEYGDFEGSIPQGNYGAGAVIVWDRGEYRVIDPPGQSAADAVRAGKLDLEMHGFKLRGAFTLVRTRGMPGPARSDPKEQWLLIKKRDEYASEDDRLAEDHPRSVLSGLTIDEMREASQVANAALRELGESHAPRLNNPYEPAAFPLNLAKIEEHPFDGDDWLFELKYDGVRALALRDGSQTRIFGRNQREITHRYPEVALALSKLPFDRFALDGEIVAPDDEGRPSFQLLQHRMHAEDARQIARLSLAMPVNYFVFDLLAFGEFDLRPLPLEDRKRILAQLIRGEGPVRYSDHVIGRGRDFFEAAQQARLEGIVAKRRNAPYRGARGGDWLKIKCPQSARFVIGGWTEPAGARIHFGALLVGQYEASGELRFVSRVGTGFDEDKLRLLSRMMNERQRAVSPFRPLRAGEAAPPRTAHFCNPELVCEVRFSEWTNDGGIRHPVFLRLVPDANPRDCAYQDGRAGADAAVDPELNASYPSSGNGDDAEEPLEDADPAASSSHAHRSVKLKRQQPELSRTFKATNLDKVFWPAEGYTKRDLLAYYETIAPWMLPYLKDRPVVLTRYPDGIDGKSFFQKDAPAFAPPWIRTEKVYSPDSRRDIAYFVLESPEAIAYMANMGAIPIHIWSSHFPHLERPDWLLFDIDPKLSTTRQAVIVAREVGTVLGEIGMRAYVKTSGQMGIHVVVGLEPRYTFEQARMFSELVAKVVVARVPDSATLIRDHAARKGRAYIDYMQLGQGKTIAAPFAVRPVPGAPVSAPIKWTELKPALEPVKFNIKTMPPRMKRTMSDPFLGALEDLQLLEHALPKLEGLMGGAER